MWMKLSEAAVHKKKKIYIYIYRMTESFVKIVAVNATLH